MVVLEILGFILSLLGILGCLLPVLPGPPLSFAALILLSIARDWQVFSTKFLIIMAAITILVTVLDYIVPAAGAKKYGASKLGVWGSIIGIIIGLVFFPPLGIFIGAFIGAILGELVTGKQGSAALRAGWGVFVGTMFGIGIKLAASVVMTFYYIKELF